MYKNRTLRVAIQQPALPEYRVPVFKELSERAGLDLTIYYSDKPDSPTNAKHIPFHAKYARMYTVKIGSRSMLWHTPQVSCATRQCCDALILSWDLHYLSLIPALLRAKANGVRTILWGHGYSKKESGFRLRLRDWVGKLADAILLYDQATAQRFIERGFKPNNVFVAPNAIDQAPIQEAKQYWLDRPEKLEAFKQERGLDAGPVILFVSRLEQANRLDLLIEALALTSDQLPTAQALIIGKGDEEERRLKILAQQQGVIDRIRFLGPIYKEQELAPYFLSSQAFCYPANIGLSILHAFGYGLPVITSDNAEAQNPEISSLKNNENGLVYANDNSGDLAKKILYLLQGNTEMHNYLSSNASDTASTQYSISKMVDGFEMALSQPS